MFAPLYSFGRLGDRPKEDQSGKPDHHHAKAKDGPRYVVRYRLGGRAYPLVHAGSFKTLRGGEGEPRPRRRRDRGRAEPCRRATRRSRRLRRPS